MNGLIRTRTLIQVIQKREFGLVPISTKEEFMGRNTPMDTSFVDTQYGMMSPEDYFGCSGLNSNLQVHW
jgi:hypothetical protein